MYWSIEHILVDFHRRKALSLWWYGCVKHILVYFYAWIAYINLFAFEYVLIGSDGSEAHVFNWLVEHILIHFNRFEALFAVVILVVVFIEAVLSLWLDLWFHAGVEVVEVVSGSFWCFCGEALHVLAQVELVVFFCVCGDHVHEHWVGVIIQLNVFLRLCLWLSNDNIFLYILSEFELVHFWALVNWAPQIRLLLLLFSRRTCSWREFIAHLLSDCVYVQRFS